MQRKLNEYKKLLKNASQGFVGRAGIVLTGSVLGQGLAFLMLPFISRIYSPESIGRASTTLAIFSMFMIVICLQYDQAVIIVDRSELPYLLLLGCLIACGVVFILGLILAVFSLMFAREAQTLTSYGVNVYLLFLLLTYAPFLLLTQLHLRWNKLSRVSCGRFIYYGLGSIVQVVNGYFLGGTELVFISSQIIAAVLATCYLLPMRSIISWLSKVNRSPQVMIMMIRQVALSYVNFPKFQAEAQFANAVSINLPVIFMRIAFSEAWAGWYFLAWRILAAPTTLISQAVGQVFYRDSAVREKKGGAQGQILESVIANLIRISLLPAIAFEIAVPIIVNLFLGPSWAPVAQISQILLIAFVVMFFTSPISMLVNIRGLQSGAFYFYNLLLITRTLALVTGWLMESAIGSVWAYTLASVFVLLSYVRYVVHAFSGSTLRIFWQIYPLLRDTAAILILALLLGFTGQLYQPFWLTLIIVLIGFCAWREIRRSMRVEISDTA